MYLFAIIGFCLLIVALPQVRTAILQAIEANIDYPVELSVWSPKVLFIALTFFACFELLALSFVLPVKEEQLSHFKSGIYFIYFLVIFIYFYSQKIVGDDIYYSTVDFSSIGHIKEFLVGRYQTWSSRLIIETLMVALIKVPFVIWTALTSLLFTLTGYLIVEMFTEKRFEDILLTLSLLLLYPITHMRSAGWIATTLNYQYPLTLGLVALKVLYDYYQNRTISLGKKIISTLCLVFACNAEQAALIIFCFYFLIILYNKIKYDKKPSLYILVNLIIALLSILFILTCPGNANRNAREMLSWYPEYANFGFAEKAYLGIVTTVAYSILELNCLLLSLSVLIAYSVKTNNKKLMVSNNLGIKKPLMIAFSIVLAIIPVLLLILPVRAVVDSLGVFKVLYYPLAPYHILDVFKTPQSFSLLSPTSIFVFFYCLCFYFLLLFGTFMSFDKSHLEKKLLACVILCAGIASRVIMGFSPTVYASGTRTFIFYWFSIIIAFVMIYDENHETINEKISLRLLLIIAIITFVIIAQL